MYAVDGYTAESMQVKWLWSILDDLGQEQLAAFLGFVTGCPSIPIDGLRPPLLLVKHVADGDQNAAAMDKILPHAHTCFNQLVFPPYSSYNIMQARFKYALENSGCGFFMS